MREGQVSREGLGTPGTREGEYRGRGSEQGMRYIAKLKWIKVDVSRTKRFNSDGVSSSNFYLSASFHHDLPTITLRHASLWLYLAHLLSNFISKIVLNPFFCQSYLTNRIKTYITIQIAGVGVELVWKSCQPPLKNSKNCDCLGRLWAFSAFPTQGFSFDHASFCSYTQCVWTMILFKARKHLYILYNPPDNPHGRLSI